MNKEDLTKEADKLSQEILHIETMASITNKHEDYLKAEDLNLKASKIQEELAKLELNYANKVNYNNGSIWYKQSAIRNKKNADKFKKANKEKVMNKNMVATELVKIAKLLIKADGQSPAQKEYQDFFKNKLDEAGVDSPADFDSDADKKEFFNDVSKEWSKK